MSFELKESHLKRLCDLNFFPVPADGMVFFGFRGCLPTDPDNSEFGSKHSLVLRDVNHSNPRCTLGQWLPKTKTFAVFPGSTVPHRSYITPGVGNKGVGSNRLSTGYYSDYRKGIHKAGTPTAHDAFKQTEARPIRRTGDDYDYENDDRVEFSNPYDNFHAAWCQSAQANKFASAGCQVVVGFPKCAKPNHKFSVGPWKTFVDNAYKITQTSFPYLLLDGKDAEKVVASGTNKLAVRLRFGSENKLVTNIQKALRKEGYYEGEIDESFKERTWRAVMNYQTARFGPYEDDGVVGPITAAALSVKWPSQ